MNNFVLTQNKNDLHVCIGKTSTGEQVDLGKWIIDDPNAKGFPGGVTGDPDLKAKSEHFLGVPFLT